MMNAVEQAAFNAAAPSFKAALAAAVAFVNNLGDDPTKIPLTAGPALQVFAGQLGLAVPALEIAEFGAARSAVVAQLNSAAAKIDALVK